MPVYNGANFLKRAARSILDQDFRDLELIITDNASTDETEAICRALAAADPRVRYYRNPANLGASRNYNLVFKLATGQYFKWQAHDDECDPTMIGKCVKYLDTAPQSVTMVYPLAELVDEHGNRLAAPLDRIESRDPRPYRRLIRLMWNLNMCDPVFGLIRRDALHRTQLIKPFFGADYVLLAQLAMIGEIHEIDEVLFRLRAHAKRSIKANPSARAVACWYDPAARNRVLVLPNWERMAWEALRAAWRSSLGRNERLLCCGAVVGTHYWRRFRNAAGRLRRAAQARLRLGLALV